MKQYDQLSLNKFSAWINKTVGKDYAIQLHLFVRLLQSLTFFGKLCLGIKRKERRTSWLRTTLADYWGTLRYSLFTIQQQGKWFNFYDGNNSLDFSYEAPTPPIFNLHCLRNGSISGWNVSKNIVIIQWGIFNEYCSFNILKLKKTYLIYPIGVQIGLYICTILKVFYWQNSEIWR